MPISSCVSNTLHFVIHLISNDSLLIFVTKPPCQIHSLVFLLYLSLCLQLRKPDCGLDLKQKLVHLLWQIQLLDYCYGLLHSKHHVSLFTKIHLVKNILLCVLSLVTASYVYDSFYLQDEI